MAPPVCCTFVEQCTSASDDGLHATSNSSSSIDNGLRHQLDLGILHLVLIKTATACCNDASLRSDDGSVMEHQG